MKLAGKTLAAIALTIAGLVVGGVPVAIGSSPPPAVGQYVALDSGSGTAVSATQSSINVSWSIHDDSGAIRYDRPCGIYVNTTNATAPNGAQTYGVGENDTSWSGTVDITPGQTVYVSLTLSSTPIGVDAHDCSHPGSTGTLAITIPPYNAPAPTTTDVAPAATTTSAAPTTTAPATTVTVTVTTTDPTVDQRLTALEQRQAADEARITALEANVGIILGEPKNLAPFTNPV